ncbi:MAG: ATP-binding cassette domain-containing protein, partial [Caulobacteraceae bacterium]
IGLYEEPTQEDRAFARSLLERLDSLELLGRTYQTLSQGEKQRVLIARGLMSSPRLLILDEPCTGLDIFAKAKLLSIIEKLSYEKDAPTLIYVTHLTEEILPAFSHTLLLRRGQVHSSGETASVLTKDNLCDFFETPVQFEKHGDRFLLRLDPQL